MPPMQITRVSSQSNDLVESNDILLENGIEDNDSSKIANKVPNSDSVSLSKLYFINGSLKYRQKP